MNNIEYAKLLNSERCTGKSTYILKQAHKQWKECEAFTKRVVSGLEPDSLDSMLRPKRPIIITSTQQNVDFLKKAYFRLFGENPKFVICNIYDYKRFCYKDYIAFVDNAEEVILTLFQASDINLKTAVMTIPNVRTFKDLF